MLTTDNDANGLDEPWMTAWSNENLESVSLCPVCKGTERKVLHKGLVDNVFRVAPGYWNLFQCKDCKSAYLDPRPDPISIDRAYTSYYTHDAVIDRDEPGLLGWFRLLRRALANGYVNDRYGTRYQPASFLGSIIARILSNQRETLDAQFRWLQKPKPGQRLLDIGCGNGEFLLKARDSGWQVRGIDPDENAVATARQYGLDVLKGSFDILDGSTDEFDVVTMSHVIEHVHFPEQLLKTAYRLLKPGGTLYIDTPNIESNGAKIFGPDWRGIECPRHLVLFSNKGLEMLLRDCGFTPVKYKPRHLMTKAMFLSSYRLTRGGSPYSKSPQSLPWGLFLRAKFSFLSGSPAEFITLLACKDKK